MHSTVLPGLQRLQRRWSTVIGMAKRSSRRIFRDAEGLGWLCGELTALPPLPQNLQPVKLANVIWKLAGNLCNITNRGSFTMAQDQIKIVYPANGRCETRC